MKNSTSVESKISKDKNEGKILARKTIVPGTGVKAIEKINKILKMLFRSALIALILVATCTYIFFCPPILTATNGSFLLFPFPAGEEFKCDSINNIKRDDVYFQNKNGDKLNGWFFQNPAPDAPVVLFSHGNGGNIGHRVFLIKALMDAGASVFIYDYRQYGRSSGTKNLVGTIEDANAAFDYLTQTRHIPEQQIVLYGESIGGGPTCQLLATRGVRGVILDSTFTSLLAVGKKKVNYFKLYPDFFTPIPAFDNRAAISAKHPPLLIIHGQKDDLIPPSEAQENFDAASEPKMLVLLPKSTHNSKAEDFALYVESLRQFLAGLEPGAGHVGSPKPGIKLGQAITG